MTWKHQLKCCWFLVDAWSQFITHYQHRPLTNTLCLKHYIGLAFPILQKKNYWNRDVFVSLSFYLIFIICTHLFKIHCKHALAIYCKMFHSKKAHYKLNEQSLTPSVFMNNYKTKCVILSELYLRRKKRKHSNIIWSQLISSSESWENGHHGLLLIS